MNLKKQLQLFRTILMEKRPKGQEKKEWGEVVMLLSLGLLWGFVNPHQIAQALEIEPNRLYGRLQQMTPEAWKGVLHRLLITWAVERLKAWQNSSDATRSRQSASLAIDDTVVKRLGKVLSYVWSWYSGQLKQVVKGQDLLGIVLRIGSIVIPIRLIWISKQGRGSTSKPEVLRKELPELIEKMKQEGIDLSALGISLDAWWVNQPISAELETMGFDKQVICGKSSLVLETDEGRQTLGEWRKELDCQPGWGHTTPACRLRGHNPTFGSLVVVFFAAKRSKAYALLVPSRPLRTSEAMRLWHNHHAVETFWKRMKRWLGLGQMQLRGRNGAWADVALRTMAYLLAQRLFHPQAATLAQLTAWFQRQSTFLQFVQEHFQADFLRTL